MRFKDPTIDSLSYIALTCECGLILISQRDSLGWRHGEPLDSRWWEFLKCKNCNKRYYSQEECDIFTVLGEEP